jgi:hypothetical protein
MSYEKTDLKVLQKNLENLEIAYQWLQRSFIQCQRIGIKKSYLPDEFDAFENLTSRFARTCDFLTKKMYRAIDNIELEESGTLIDVMNKAHKRGLVDSPDEVREIKKLRNIIAHEYANENLISIFIEVFNQTPLLSILVERVQNFCKEKYFIC